MEQPQKDARVPLQGKRNVLITAALPYVNNVPHLGNIIGSVLSADVYARYCRQRGYNTVFLCGTDEYGTATETKALEEKVTPKEICDKYYPMHRDIYRWIEIEFDVFGRTSTEAQTKIAQDIFLKLQANGYTFERTSEQLYCLSCQRFLADRYVEGICPKCDYTDARGDQCDKCGQLLSPTELREPRCKLDRQRPEIRPTQHIYLDLPKIQPLLDEWLAQRACVHTWSRNALATTRAWLANGLEARCITRDLKWGTPVPVDGFRDKVFYVWFDAPIGYISIAANFLSDWEAWWKAPEKVELVQFMGKDNTPFHTIVFPCSLLGTKENYTLLRCISTAEYLQYEGGKFSKSRGTGVFGDDMQKTGLPPHVWRYYLLRNRPESSDTMFSWSDMVAKNNGELLNNVGNFVHRVVSFCTENFGGIVPGPSSSSSSSSSDVDFIKQVNEITHAYVEALESVQLRAGLESVLQLAHLGNQYLNDRAPWKLIKQQRDESGRVLTLLCNVVEHLSRLLSPYLPSVARKIRRQLGVSSDNESRDLAIDKHFVTERLRSGHKLGDAIEPIISRISEAQQSALEQQFGGKRTPLTVIKDTGVQWPCILLQVRDLVVKRKSAKTDAWLAKALAGGVDLQQLEKRAHVQEYDRERRARGIDVGPNENSVVNLMSLFKTNGALPNINTVVDIYNVLSMKHGIVMGAYDTTSMAAPLQYVVASGNEYFVPVGTTQREAIQPGEWVLKDANNVVITKATTKQSSTFSVTLETRSCIVCIQGNPLLPLESLRVVAQEVGTSIVSCCGGTFEILFSG